MEIRRLRGYIESFTEDEVTVVVISDDYQETRVFKIYPLFAGMELFEYKNFLLEIEHEGNSQTCRCLESSESKIQQIINAWTTIN